MSEQAWRTGTGAATTGHGAVVRAQQAIELAGGDHRLLAVAMGSIREITAYGHTHRLFTETQRCAMAARDGGCTFPGCDVPAAWCQADHVVEYRDGGKSAVSNGHLLCGYHHRAKNTHDWHVQMIDGRAGWTPPPWLDPRQTPRFNQTHRPTIHLPDG